MKIRDLVSISFGNLVRMKLRTFLTVSGVIIAIAAFIAMLSFGAGMQKNVNDQFNELGLLHTIIVYSGDSVVERVNNHSSPDSASPKQPRPRR